MTTRTVTFLSDTALAFAAVEAQRTGGGIGRAINRLLERLAVGDLAPAVAAIVEEPDRLPLAERHAVGAGRGNKAPPGTKVVTRSITFDPELLAAVDVIADRTGQNRSLVIDRLLRASLNSADQP